MEPIEFYGVVRDGAARRCIQVTPPAEDYPAGTRILVGVALDPNQPGQFAPFTCIERPTETGWHSQTWQPPALQGGRVPAEAGGDDDPESEDFFPRLTRLLGVDHLYALPPEPTQPFRRENA